MKYVGFDGKWFSYGVRKGNSFEWENTRFTRSELSRTQSNANFVYSWNYLATICHLSDLQVETSNVEEAHKHLVQGGRRKQELITYLDFIKDTKDKVKPTLCAIKLSDLEKELTNSFKQLNGLADFRLPSKFDLTYTDLETDFISSPEFYLFSMGSGYRNFMNTLVEYSRNHNGIVPPYVQQRIHLFSSFNGASNGFDAIVGEEGLYHSRHMLVHAFKDINTKKRYDEKRKCAIKNLPDLIRDEMELLSEHFGHEIAHRRVLSEVIMLNVKRFDISEAELSVILKKADFNL